MELNDILHNPGEWLRAGGPDGDIVISSRARLARNLADRPFMTRMNERDQAAVVGSVRAALGSAPLGKGLTFFSLESLSPLERRFLVERHLISREQEEGEGARGVAFDPEESVAVMINEEDHIRLQALRCGLQLREAYGAVDAMDDELAARLPVAFDKEYGYLTACPTNVGTGLRVSVMLHLPALVISEHIEKAFRAVHDLKLAVRGLYGEGTEAHGEFYQVSNQITLGRSEEEILEDLRATIDNLTRYERRARERLLEKQRPRLEDRVWRSYAALRYARIMNSEEAMRHLSGVRLGVHCEILPGLAVEELNKIFLYIQPAHLQRLEGRELPAEERDRVRARYLREQIKAAE